MNICFSSRWDPLYICLKRYEQGKECAHMNLNNQQDSTWSPNKMSRTSVKWWVHLYMAIKKFSMTNSKFSRWNGGETETSCSAGKWMNIRTSLKLHPSTICNKFPSPLFSHSQLNNFEHLLKVIETRGSVSKWHKEYRRVLRQQRQLLRLQISQVRALFKLWKWERTVVGKEQGIDTNHESMPGPYKIKLGSRSLETH